MKASGKCFDFFGIFFFGGQGFDLAASQDLLESFADLYFTGIDVGPCDRMCDYVFVLISQ